MPFLIAGAVALVALGTAGGYLLWGNAAKNSDSVITPSAAPTLSVNSAPTATPALTDSMKQVTNLPPDWKYEKSMTCAVSLPLPPTKEPFVVLKSASNAANLDSGGSWQFEEHNKGEAMFPNIAQVYYSKPDLPAGDYVAGNVMVACAANTQNYTTKSLVEKFQAGYKDNTNGLTFKNLGDKTMWGHTVTAFSIEGGFFSAGHPEYIFATKTHIYRVSNMSFTSNSGIKLATQNIFEGLLFDE